MLYKRKSEDIPHRSGRSLNTYSLLPNASVRNFTIIRKPNGAPWL